MIKEHENAPFFVDNILRNTKELYGINKNDVIKYIMGFYKYIKELLVFDVRCIVKEAMHHLVIAFGFFKK